MNDLISFGDAEKMAAIISKSGLMPSSLRSKPQDVFVLIQMGNELGIKPMQAINGIHVIQGKPTIAPQTMLALIYSRNKDSVIEVVEDNQKQEVKCTMKRSKNDAGYTSAWDLDRAKKMGLTGKDNWNKQPMTMLKWRAISDAARVVFPDVIQGFYTPEEMDPDLSLDEIGNPEPVQVENLNQKKEVVQLESAPENKKLGCNIVWEYILTKVCGDKDKAKELLTAISNDLGFKREDYDQEKIEFFKKEIDQRTV
jgi:hypothetical protein